MSELQKQVDLVFLALCLWRESRGSSISVQTGIAQVIVNRAKKAPDVSSVIIKKRQFSSFTDPKDPQLTTWPESSDKSWIHCLELAEQVLRGDLQSSVANATNYHDTSVVPAWADPEKLVSTIENIKFYDLS